MAAGKETGNDKTPWKPEIWHLLAQVRFWAICALYLATAPAPIAMLSPIKGFSAEFPWEQSK